MNVGACSISDAQARHAVETYTALHEGREPDEFLCEPWRAPRPTRQLGRALQIQYAKLVPEGDPSYEHPWAVQAHPRLAIDQDGLPLLYAGRCETTRRGIEDRVTPGMPTVEYLKQPYVQREYLPRAPKMLTTLGRLEWILYKGNDGTEKRLQWDASNAPWVAHDERGDLHFLPATPARGDEDTMARRRSRRSHKSHHGMTMGSKRHARHNPSGRSSKPSMSMGEKSGRFVMGTSLMALTGVAEIAAVNLALTRFWPTLSDGYKSATKIGIGILGGLGLAMVVPPGTAQAVPTGFAVGGILDGLNELYQANLAPQVNAALLPAAPAAQALLPAGMPANYVGYNPAACAVGVR